MKTVFIYFLILSIPSFAAGQLFQFKRIPLDKIDSVELNQNSKKFIYDYTIGVAQNYFPKRKSFRIAQPIVFRKPIGNYFLETSYYFSIEDSTLRLIEYWWRDTTYSLNFSDTLTEKNKIIISNFFNKKRKSLPENEDHGAKTIWKNRLYYVQQFPVADGVRVLISWRKKK
jgi:hypothetical protein